MTQFKRRLAGFHAAAALATLLCVAAQTAKADNLGNDPCGVTFTVSHPDTIGRPGSYVIKLVYTLPPGFKFTNKDLVKGPNSPKYSWNIDASGNLVLTMSNPPNQFPASSTSPSSFQFQKGISSSTLSCNYRTQDLQGMLVTTSLSDGFITTSRFAPDTSGNMAGGTGTPAADVPAAIDPTIFTSTGLLPCSTGTELDKMANGCPVGLGADGVPALEGGQLWQSPAIRSCKPSGALAALLQNSNDPSVSSGSVTAYVANGSWSTSNTGIQVVPIEPTPVAAATPVSTGADVINSCASNSVTGQTVCVANNSNVYLLSGSTVASIRASSAAATPYAGFSDGSCANCGIAIDQTTNTAAITLSLNSGTQTGIQFLDLASGGNFSAPVPAANQVSGVILQISEGIVWDPVRNLILSPSEASLGEGNSGLFDLFDTSMVNPPFSSGQQVSAPEYTNTVSEGGGQVQLDSAAEDCTTGIALATNEAQSKLYLADLTQRQLGSGTWTTAQNIQTLSKFAGYVPGTTGIAVAPGSQLAIITGEFGGNKFGVLQLPATSGSGTPALVNDVAATLPNLPDGTVWSQGLDPHAITAYVSPNDGKAYGVLANAPKCSDGSYLPPTYLAVIDLAATLAATPSVRYIPTGATGVCPPTLQ